MSITPFQYLSSVKTTFGAVEQPKAQTSARIPSPRETIEAQKLDTELKAAGKDKANALNEEAVRALKGQESAQSPIPSVDQTGNKRGVYVKVSA